jgi:hypothetical protein
MRVTDIDWRMMLNEWDEVDIRYLRCVCEEKLIQINTARTKRRAIIRGEV